MIGNGFGSERRVDSIRDRTGFENERGGADGRKIVREKVLGMVSLMLYIALALLGIVSLTPPARWWVGVLALTLGCLSCGLVMSQFVFCKRLMSSQSPFPLFPPFCGCDLVIDNLGELSFVETAPCFVDQLLTNIFCVDKLAAN